MNEIPDFWREEIWHPLTVHFPIALLLVATIFKLVSLKIKREVFGLGGTLLLLLGVVSVWVAIYTGNLADGIVSRKICDPTILKDHENAAYLTAWLFSAALSFDILIWAKLSFFKNVFFKIATALLLLTGSGFLAYTGHLGATLVYQQAAGVYKPASDCAEFE